MNRRKLPGRARRWARSQTCRRVGDPPFWTSSTIAWRKACRSGTRTSLVRRGVITAVEEDGATIGCRSCARALSISAPAAADDASQARVMSPDRAASRRIAAALSARCAALTSSAWAARHSSGGAIVLNQLEDRSTCLGTAARTAGSSRPAP